ncbi:hypothetical protein TIFTF001_008136 [Ficus carica]|uniref:Uncharacterized protein n=1 Tax=Ficus carica TaxID=3494 RepID=A0AA88DGW3_FICCA|nr:hypothetical protein TIFTF001_008136 [Ficus carica]
MESSQDLGTSDQESGDSESGWTMYIGSQILADDEEGNGNKPVSRGGEGEESDDSMASDASSGPILQELNPDAVKEGSEMLGGVMDRVDVEGIKCFSANKKPCKVQLKNKRDERRIKREKNAQQKALPKADSAESQV